MTSYRGSCHCGAIRFELRTRLGHLSRCNCSLDVRRNALLHYVPPEDFRLVAGEDQLATYRFGSETTDQHFCRTCGVFPFFFSRYGGQEKYGINVGCLEGVDPWTHEIQLIDGRSF